MKTPRKLKKKCKTHLRKFIKANNLTFIKDSKMRIIEADKYGYFQDKAELL